MLYTKAKPLAETPLARFPAVSGEGGRQRPGGGRHGHRAESRPPVPPSAEWLRCRRFSFLFSSFLWWAFSFRAICCGGLMAKESSSSPLERDTARRVGREKAPRASGAPGGLRSRPNQRLRDSVGHEAAGKTVSSARTRGDSVGGDRVAPEETGATHTGVSCLQQRCHPRAKPCHVRTVPTCSPPLVPQRSCLARSPPVLLEPSDP